MPTPIAFWGVTLYILFGIPGRGEEVEDIVEDEWQVCVALSHQKHHCVAAGGSDDGMVAATLFPQGLQCWTLCMKKINDKNFYIRAEQLIEFAIMLQVIKCCCFFLNRKYCDHMAGIWMKELARTYLPTTCDWHNYTLVFQTTFLIKLPKVTLTKAWVLVFLVFCNMHFWCHFFKHLKFFL